MIVQPDYLTVRPNLGTAASKSLGAERSVEAFGVSETTIKFHQKNLFETTGRVNDQPSDQVSSRSL